MEHLFGPGVAGAGDARVRLGTQPVHPLEFTDLLAFSLELSCEKCSSLLNIFYVSCVIIIQPTEHFLPRMLVIFIPLIFTLMRSYVLHGRSTRGCASGHCPSHH
jgi:hypothetical protein